MKDNPVPKRLCVDSRKLADYTLFTLFKKAESAQMAKKRVNLAMKSLMMSVGLMSITAQAMHDKLALVVGKTLFTQSELNAYYQQEKKISGSKVHDEKAFMQNFIAEQLQLNFAKKVGLELTEAEQKGVIDELLDLHKVNTRAQLNQVLLSKKIDPDAYIAHAQRGFYVQKIQSAVLAPKMQKVEVDYEACKAHVAQTVKEFKVVDVVFKKPKAADSIADYTKLMHNYKAAWQKGRVKTMKSIELKRSVHVLDWKTVSQLPDMFQAQLSNMKLGEVSEIIKAENGWHLIKLAEERPLESLPEGEELTQICMQREFTNQVDQWVEELRRMEVVEEIT